MATSSRFASTYDCVIVGAGPAGLTCAIFLGRYRRRVLVIDAGSPRNYASTGIHGFLGQHEIRPAELLRRGRAEAESVGVEFFEASVDHVATNGELFEVHVGDECINARRVVLAYGVRDIKPDLPRFEEFYGRGIHHCPDCDGYEARDSAIGIVGSGKAAAGLALKMLQWSDQIRIFTHGEKKKLNKEETSKLLAKNIDVREEKIIELLENDGKLCGVVLQSGEKIDVDSLFFTIGTERSCNLAEGVGCTVYRAKPNIRVNRHRETSVKGIFAVGDLVEGSQLVVTAAADGAIAAIEINKSLLEPARKV